MTAEKVLEFTRQLGKYTCICTVVIAVLNGLIHQQFWAPFYVSIACWIGLIVWVISLLGLKINRKLSSGVANGSRA
jgi:hypothetical protein